MDNIFYEPLGELTLRIFAVTLLLMAWNGVLRGFFLGNGAAFPVAVSLLLEQIVVLAAGFPLANLLKDYGSRVGALLLNENFSLSFASAGFAGGIFTGTAFSFLFLIILYLASRSYFIKRNGKDSGRGREGIAQVAGVFFACLFPLLIYAIVTRGCVLLEQIMFRQFMQGGLDGDVISAQWGIYFAKYKMLTAIPVILAVAMGSTLRERVRSFHKKEDFQHMRDVVQTVFKVTMALTIPLSVMLGTLAEPVLSAFYHGQETEDAAMLLLCGFMTPVFLSAAFLMAEILWGVKRRALLLFCGAASFAACGGVLYIMLEILHLDIFGVLYADILSAFILFLLTVAAVQKKCRFRYGLLRSVAPSLIASAVMGVMLFLLGKALTGVLPDPVLPILLFLLGMLVYFVLLLLLRGISERELVLIPGGKWIAAAAKKSRLLL